LARARVRLFTYLRWLAGKQLGAPNQSRRELIWASLRGKVRCFTQRLPCWHRLPAAVSHPDERGVRTRAAAAPTARRSHQVDCGSARVKGQRSALTKALENSAPTHSHGSSFASTGDLPVLTVGHSHLVCSRQFGRVCSPHRGEQSQPRFHGISCLPDTKHSAGGAQKAPPAACCWSRCQLISSAKVMRVCVTWVMTTLARLDPEAEKVGHRPVLHAAHGANCHNC
jgi:hypothetical protein